jgi:hypothetical protein
MRVSFRDREERLAEDLAGLKALPLSFADLRGYDLAFLFRVDAFPPRVLKFCGDWEQYVLGERAVVAHQEPAPPGPRGPRPGRARAAGVGPPAAQVRDLSPFQSRGR